MKARHLFYAVNVCFEGNKINSEWAIRVFPLEFQEGGYLERWSFQRRGYLKGVYTTMLTGVGVGHIK